MYNYPEAYMRLQEETAIVTFKKKDNTIRVMLCTRNIKTANIIMKDINRAIGLLNGHDKRCGIQNGNMAVHDLVLGECRSFNIDRVLEIKYFGHIMTEQELDNVFTSFRQYEASISDIYNANDVIEQMIVLEARRVEEKAEENNNSAVNNSVNRVEDASMKQLREWIKADKEMNKKILEKANCV